MHISQHPWFSKITRPSRYLGEETHAVAKNPSDVDIFIALAFPDVYEIGMSHVGLKLLYHILNAQPWIAAERVFVPWIDLEHEMKARGIPLSSLESEKPLSEFDIIGFSLQHELCYTNILSLLDLGRIPFLSEQRGSEEPLIIAGGPACFNPEPVAALFDAILIGDGEEAAVAICRTVRDWKQSGAADKIELLEKLATIQGVYIPSFFSVCYGPRGRVTGIKVLHPGYSRIEKSVVPDLNAFPFPSRQVVPLLQPVHDRFTIDIARGCSRGCRFCQAGMIYRPVRERSPQEILRIAQQGLQETGYEDLSLLSLSSGDYSGLLPLVRELMTRVANHHVAISFSSLRADGIISPLMEEIKKVRKTSFTIAPEAGSQRMRDVINKGLSEEQILHAVTQIYQAGWTLIKLYFMIGLPGEQESDIEAIVQLSKKIARLAPSKRGGNVLNVSVATFVPKSHTPFQWLPQLELEQARKKIDYIRNSFHSKRVKVKWNKPEASWLEGMFSRGDRRLADALIDAWKEGARFDSWSERLDLDIWRNAFDRHHLHPEFYLYRQRDEKEILPWEHIQCGVSKEFLLKEWRRAQQGKTTPDCREHCSDCGVCKDLSVSPLLFNEAALTDTSFPAEGRIKGRMRRFRVHFTKLHRGRYLSHLELVRLFIRALRRAGISMVYSNGYHPMPKVSFATALPVGMESMDEVADLSLYESGTIPQRFESVNQELPSGIKSLSIEEVPITERPPQVKESVFQITVPGCVHKEDILRFLHLPAYQVTQKRRKGERRIDIRSQVKEVRLLSDGEIEMVVRHNGGGPTMKPSEIIEHICSLSASQSEGMRVLKTKSVLA